MQTFTVLDLIDRDYTEDNHLGLTCIAGRSGLNKEITSSKISRPGLPLAGFFEAFSAEAIQIFGRGEQAYVAQLSSAEAEEHLCTFFASNLPCCVFSDGGEVSQRIIDLGDETATPILVTDLSSSVFTSRLIQSLDLVFAPTETIHAVFLEVFGIGVLITGESGVGKSETALELVERGHRLISDDTVRLRSIGDTALVGMGENPLLAHHMEIRGLGIINLASLYGVGSIRERKQVQLAIHLEPWDASKEYDRIGDANLTATYLGIDIPKVLVPVKPGRNIPIIIETAARNERLKEMGYYAAKQFDQSVLRWLESEAVRQTYREDSEVQR